MKVRHIKPLSLALGLGVLAACAAAGQPSSPAMRSNDASFIARSTVAVHAASALHPTALATTPGVLYTWGDDDAGQLGNGYLSDPSNHFRYDEATPAPAILPTGTLVSAMAAGLSDTVIVTTAGQVYVTGFDGYGQLGNGVASKSGNVVVPVLASIPSGVTITDVSIGHDNVIALSSSGQVYTWGENLEGETGLNSAKHDIDVPTLVESLASESITTIGTGGYHDLVTTSTGAVYDWGENTDGELGNGTTTQSNAPVQVQFPGGVKGVAVAGGDNHSLALTPDGSVYAWGLNNHGQLGNGKEINSSLPVKVKLPAGASIVQIAAGEDYSLALDANGTIYAWGDNASGNLGNNTRTDSDVPIAVEVPNGVVPVQIAAGGNRCHLISTTSEVYDWGSNEVGLDSHLHPVLDDMPPGETPLSIVADGVEAEQYLLTMVPTGDALIRR